jgi:hypothetical protein
LFRSLRVGVVLLRVETMRSHILVRVEVCIASIATSIASNLVAGSKLLF